MEQTMSTKSTRSNTGAMGTTRGEVLREYGGYGPGGVHGVTFDGQRVWFARDNEIVAVEPESGEVSKRIPTPADAGTAFDGEHLYQIAGQEILVLRPTDGAVVRRLPAPGKGNDSGIAYADGFLWVGQYKDATIHQIDAKTGAVVKTLKSDRWVTGVSCFEGELWHAVAPQDEQPAEIRRLAADGAVEETITLPKDVFVSGLEATPEGFWCGGGLSGKLRLVRRVAT